MGGGGGSWGEEDEVSPCVRDVVQGVKEIVNRPDMEIFMALRECNMDLDMMVNRLLPRGERSTDGLPEIDRRGQGSLAKGSSPRGNGKVPMIKGIAELSPPLVKAPMREPMDEFLPIMDANLRQGSKSHPGLVIHMRDCDSGSSLTRKPKSTEQREFISPGMY
jgi:hypothetical protein